MNPSLTIMALATRLAAYLDADPDGYLGPRAAAATLVPGHLGEGDT